MELAQEEAIAYAIAPNTDDEEQEEEEDNEVEISEPKRHRSSRRNRQSTSRLNPRIPSQCPLVVGHA